MPVFRYKARGTHGDAIEGTLEANSTDIVASRLIEGGLTPVDIEPLPDGIKFGHRLNQLFSPKVEAADLIQFSRQMHSMLRAGVPIFTTINTLRNTCSNRTLAQTLSKVAEDLESGRPLSDALAQHPGVFSMFYVSLIRVGETTGKLDDIFQQLAVYVERKKITRNKIKSALRYPLFVISAIVVAVTVISVWVIPAFSRLFSRFGAELPLPTRILIAVSDFMVAYWPVLLIVIIGIVVGLRLYVDTELGRYRWDKLKLRLPLVGSVIYQASMARFSHLFSLALNANVPLITVLTVVSRALDNSFLQERVEGMREGVEHGNRLSLSAANSGVFDALVLQMLAVGEESGTISTLLQEVAEHYDREVEYTVEKLSSSIEPVLTLVISGLVLILALGVFLPMWDLASAALH